MPGVKNSADLSKLKIITDFLRSMEKSVLLFSFYMEYFVILLLLKLLFYGIIF